MFSSNASQVSGDAVYVEDVFSTYVYTGDGSSGRYVTNNIDLSGKGGMVWIKNRSADGHVISDTARGGNGNPIPYLQSNQTSAETVTTTAVDSFYGSGFLVNTNSSVNASGYNYASWTFRKQKKFFDVLTYTGTGGSQTINHNLGSTPGCIIVKCTSAGSTSWYVYHRSLNDNSGNPYFLVLNTTAAQDTGGGVWGTPTSTQFTVQYPNASGQTYVAYLFAHDAGGFGLTGTDNVISCGSFTTDGSGNATVSLGYEPQWLMVKRTNSAGSWEMVDCMRGWNQTQYQLLAANLSNAESATGAFGFPTATGFQFVNGWQAPSSPYIYIAIRRGPMKVPTDGTTVFTPATRTGTGATANITNGFVTDLVISQARGNVGSDPSTFDRLRGATIRLRPDSIGAELTATDSLTSFASMTGVTVGADSSTQSINWSGTGGTYVTWSFQRAPSFFDEVCYTGDGTLTPINHNLTVVPELIIYKRRNATQDWWVVDYVRDKVGKLNLTDAFTNANTSPNYLVNATTMVPYLNTSGLTYVAYLFATCAGVSKVGSYTGTGTTQQINCGFAAGARFVMIKRTDSTGDWYVWDSARGIVAGNDPYLLLNSTAAEVTSTDYVDTYAAGFELTSTAPAAINASGGTYIFLAIA